MTGGGSGRMPRGFARHLSHGIDTDGLVSFPTRTKGGKDPGKLSEGRHFPSGISVTRT
jgi:hypothetical protein